MQLIARQWIRGKSFPGPQARGMGMLFSTSKKSKNKSKAAKRGTLTFDTTGCDKVCPMIAEKKKTGVSDYGGRIVVARRVYAVEQENGSVEGEFSVVRWGVWEARESGSFGRTPGGMRVEEVGEFTGNLTRGGYCFREQRSREPASAERADREESAEGGNGGVEGKTQAEAVLDAVKSFFSASPARSRLASSRQLGE
ncbi:hypothetical protein I7I50_03903 [Histoplasma capsulatum G186AR]|uniref:Uncharacterized protein n=1 Tax=Ajellomyces capsulatus TaxID=5037 RepID=A0A8H7YJF7_AJECA|nr:hypothetical protein I7I52_04811 [Histoplasma capsulatum]QSS74935.1 hypothetical protein I7I50_03903 [Histoplasma capsulatum G186AR]